MIRFLETTNITSYVHKVSFCIASRLSVFTQAVCSLFDYRWQILQLRGGKLPERTLSSCFVLNLFQLVQKKAVIIKCFGRSRSETTGREREGSR